LECIQNVQHLEYFDVDQPEWYPVSTAQLWQSVQGQDYKILVRARSDDHPGVYDRGDFELTVVQRKRPTNDECPLAQELEIGKKYTGSTDFATVDDELVCSPVSLGEAPTAPGVYFKVTAGHSGRLQVAVDSSYAAQITVFQGDDCDALVCLEGTDNPPPDATSLAAVLSSDVQWDCDQEQDYYILVHGSDSTVGVFDITVTQLKTKPAETTTEATTQAPETSTLKPETTESSTATVWDVQTYASLAFGFFPGADLDSPSNNDVGSVMEQVSNFFSNTFQGIFDDAFIRFEATAYDVSFDEQNVLPIVISFAAKAYFTSEQTASSAQDMFGLMAGADFQNFIRSYAWQTEPFGETIFFQTLRVSFEEARVSPPDSDVDQSSNTSQEEAVQRVAAKVSILFSFFPDATLREPSQDEVYGLVKQARSFFSKAFESKFDSFVRFGAVATAVNFTQGEELPIEILFDVSAFFSLVDSNGTTTDVRTPTQIVSAMEDAELTDFIQNYIWRSEPFGQNLFYETMHVQIKQEGTGRDETATEVVVSPSSGLHFVTSPDKAVVNISLSYSFHDTATVAFHEPGPEEIDGLLNQTVDFFSQVIFDELPSSSSIKSINLVASSADYNEDRKFSVVVYAQLEVNFNDEYDQSSASVSQRPSVEQIIALCKFLSKLVPAAMVMHIFVDLSNQSINHSRPS
jgi:hypothetical protein